MTKQNKSVNITLFKALNKMKGGEFMSFDYSKLKGRIKEKFETQGNFAAAIGTSERTLSLKLNNERAWTQTEIVKSMEALELEETDLHLYFFYPQSSKC